MTTSYRERAVLLLSVPVTALLLSLSPVSVAETSLEIAIKMIERFNVGSNLKTLGKGVASRTLTYAIMVRQFGPYKAQLLTSEELERALPRFQDQWNRKLAESYLEHFPVEALESMYKFGPSSPYRGEIAAAQDAIGKTMNQKAEKVLLNYVSEAVVAAFRRANEQAP